MSERWKPKKGEKYWLINIDGSVFSTIYRNDNADVRIFKFCNIFKAKEEAEAAAEKVTELLFNLQANDETLQANDETLQANDESLQDKQLPKLTAEVFDRPDCPDWAEYAAVNQDGGAFFYRHKPAMHCAIGWSYYAPCYGSDPWKNIPGTWDATDWKNSLIERTAKLPDWCKVGEWVYHDSDGYYYTVKSVDTQKDDIQISDGESEYTYTANEIKTFFSEARLRPYNADEMRSLVGKVVGDKDGNIYLVVCYVPRGRGLLIGGCYFDEQKIIDSGFIIDGKPCGKFEHLENGEWVE